MCTMYNFYTFLNVFFTVDGPVRGTPAPSRFGQSSQSSSRAQKIRKNSII